MKQFVISPALERNVRNWSSKEIITRLSDGNSDIAVATLQDLQETMP